MKRNELIKRLEETRRLLIEETEGLTDYAREKACIDIEDAIEHIKENEE